MARLAAVLLTLLVLAGCGKAPTPTRLPTSRAIEQAASKVIEAVEAQDNAALKALAEKEDPDPWIVADELCYRGQHDAAEAFAKAAPRMAVAKLPSYVASRRGKGDERKARAELSAANTALDRSDWDEALHLLPSDEALPGTVIQVALTYARGRALQGGGEHERAASIFQRVVSASRAAGWINRALSAQGRTAECLHALEDWQGALTAYRHGVTLAEQLGNRVEMAGFLTNAGTMHRVLGDLDAATIHQRRALRISQESHDQDGEAWAHYQLACTHKLAGRSEDALQEFKESLRLEEARGAEARAAQTLHDIGTVYYEMGRPRDAITSYRRAIAIRETIGARADLADTLHGIATALSDARDESEALKHAGRALDIFTSLSDESGVSDVQLLLGNIFHAFGRHRTALEHYEEARDVRKRLGKLEGVAGALHNMAVAYEKLGHHREAVVAYEEALELRHRLSDSGWIARILVRKGYQHEALGESAAALDHYHRALAVHEAMKNKAGVASALGAAADLYGMLNQFERALDASQRARVLFEELKDDWGKLGQMLVIAAAHRGLDEGEKALVVAQEALEIAERLRDRERSADALRSVGATYVMLRRPRAAVPFFNQALKIRGELGDHAGAGSLHDDLSHAQWNQGDRFAAVESAGRAVEALRHAGDPRRMAAALGRMATLNLSVGLNAQAVVWARQAGEIALRVIHGLGVEEAASARDHYFHYFEVGILGALRAGDADGLAWFLEAARAGSLRNAYGERDVVAEATVPEEFRVRLSRAKRAEQDARRAYQATLRSRSKQSIEAARRSLQAAEDNLQAAVTDIRRSEGLAAALAFPAPDDLSSMRKRLGSGEALVLYGLSTYGATQLVQVDRGMTTRSKPGEDPYWSTAVALVVEPSRVRIVRLQNASEIRVIVDLLRREGPTGAHARDPSAPRGLVVQPAEGRSGKINEAAIERLRSLIIDPLKLPPEVKRVLISPMGSLGYAPFGLLLPERDVALVPSGTTYGLLLAGREARGRDVLALGDPDYERTEKATVASMRRSASRLDLAPLPETRGEVEAVGTVKLLGAKATEKGLATTLTTRKRWRAVHLACHGLLDPDRPMFSSLALTAEGDHDGFLTALEVLQMKIPADLVVLSACETGKGKVYMIAGIVGMARAFMQAGATRVLCSLWKVDDAATRALMVKFYELWNPKQGEGIGASAALRKAQAFVRSHEQWKHPDYWAAWVLWGLP